jgi:16S rRNA (cytosine967-C5)-methyltransferase
MTPGARLQAAIDITGNIDRRRNFVPADAVVHQYFKTRRYIGSKDRRSISETVYTALRHRSRIDWWLARVGLEPEARSRIIATLLVAEQMDPQKVEGLFGGDRFSPAELTKPEYKALKALAGRTADHPEMPEHIRLECPDWAEAPLRRVFGDRFAREMDAINQPAPVDLRINPMKITRAEGLELLKGLGVEAQETRLSPWGLRLSGRHALADSTPFKQGLLEVQDEGSQLVAALAGAKPGMQIVDFCAGAGGKALVMAAEMKGKGRVVACDVNQQRLDRAGERAVRADLHNIERRLLETERDPWVKRHKLKFDRVLVDAPCSGTGTWRRNPDARWGRGGPDLEELTTIQNNVLASACRLVRPGGRLLYATCSVLAEEDEDCIERFLAAQPDFRALDVREVWAEVLGTPCPVEGPYLRLSPGSHDTDGFFCAVLERAPAEEAPAA